MGRKVLYVLDNIEGYFCRFLLATFVTLLFIQILSRQLFNYSFSWTEELSVYMFVWFVFFGASYAARQSAHNRVTFQYKLMPAWLPPILEVISDFIWVIFNGYFVYLSYDFVFNRMNLFWKSQTLGIPMKYIYLVLPIAFALMTLRILQVNYLKLVAGTKIENPDDASISELIEFEPQEVSSSTGSGDSDSTNSQSTNTQSTKEDKHG